METQGDNDAYWQDKCESLEQRCHSLQIELTVNKKSAKELEAELKTIEQEKTKKFEAQLNEAKKQFKKKFELLNCEKQNGNLCTSIEDSYTQESSRKHVTKPKIEKELQEIMKEWGVVVDWKEEHMSNLKRRIDTRWNIKYEDGIPSEAGDSCINKMKVSEESTDSDQDEAGIRKIVLDELQKWSLLSVQEQQEMKAMISKQHQSLTKIEQIFDAHPEIVPQNKGSSNPPPEAEESINYDFTETNIEGLYPTFDDKPFSESSNKAENVCWEIERLEAELMMAKQENESLKNPRLPPGEKVSEEEPTIQRKKKPTWQRHGVKQNVKYIEIGEPWLESLEHCEQQ